MTPSALRAKANRLLSDTAMFSGVDDIGKAHDDLTTFVEALCECAESLQRLKNAGYLGSNCPKYTRLALSRLEELTK